MPFKYIRIETPLSSEEVLRKISESTDQDRKSIYWGKRFYKTFSGKVGARSFIISPVVPYWNISPVDIEGNFSSGNKYVSRLHLRMVCPYLRFVIPLVILTLVLFFINFGTEIILFKGILITLATAYLLVNIPFQLQSKRSLDYIVRMVEGKIVHYK
ncbi:MAG: hypothetical protein R6U04_11810 [Bacteroidales bacterium]